MEPTRTVLTTLLSTVGVAILSTMAARRLALTAGLMARPRADRWHAREVPMLGGAGMLAALLFAYSVLYTAPQRHSGWLFGVCIVFLVGLVDDCRGLSPFLKLIGQVSAACVAMLLGVNLHGVPLVLATPLSLLWIVALTNAFNLLDNMDGLAAGTAVICSLVLFVQAWMGFEPALAIPCLALAGTALGFLIFNYHPARIFMGDCGSMVVGFSLATFSLMGASSLAPNVFLVLLFPCMVLAVPLFDTGFVTFMRTLHGRSVAVGGRDHTSHRLVFLGVPEQRVVALLWGLSALVGTLGLLGLMANRMLLLVAGAVIAVALCVFGAFLAQVEVYSSDEIGAASQRHARRGETVLSRAIEGKRRLAEAGMDLLLMIACFVGAFLLRYDGALEASRQQLLNLTLPLVVVVQLAMFYLFGMYTGLWRYVSIDDLVRLGEAVAVSLVLTSLGLLTLLREQTVPFSILFNNALLLLVCAGGFRVLLRVLRHALIPLAADARPALIVGAGDAGEIALREILNNRSLNLRPVGFIDDNPGKARAAIHGLHVLGDRSRLPAVVAEHGVEELIIALPSVSNGVVEELVRFCDEHRIAYREFSGILSEAKNGYRGE